MIYDKRLFRVVLDHSQPRPYRPRVGVVAKGWNFVNGKLDGMWVSPVTGVLQSKPNSEEEEYATQNTGRWKKLALADVTPLDQNSAAGEFKMMTASGMHADSAIYYSGNNTQGVGAVTSASYPQNTGVNVTQYAYEKATGTGKVILEGGWGGTANYLEGESFRVFDSGQIEVWRHGVLKGRGSFGGSGYSFGTAQGGSYVKPDDEFLSLRVEPSRDRYLLFTSSKGGVYLFPCDWAETTYRTDGSVDQEAQPIVSANPMWFRIPQGGCCVVWSPVVWVSNGTAVSDAFALSEPPGTGRTLSARPIPESSNVTVGLVAEDGTGTFDVHTNRCRVKVTASSAPVWVDGTSTRYEPIPMNTVGMGESGDGIDVTEWVRDVRFQEEDSPDGPVLSLEISLAIWREVAGAWEVIPCPAAGLTEQENRPVRLELVAHPDDPDSPPTTVILDGVCSPPEFFDGRQETSKYVKLEAHDRLVLLKDVKVTEPVIFDEAWLCRPPSEGDCALAVVLRQGAIEVPVDLPDIDYRFEYKAPQKAGQWTFEAKAGRSWWDVLVEMFEHAPSLIWGMRPKVGGMPEFFVIDPSVSASPVATLYKTPEDAEEGGASFEGELGVYPSLYAEHSRRKLPLEGNLVHVLGMDHGTQTPILATRSDDASRDPAGVRGENWLGSTRTVGFQSAAIVSQRMADRIADSLAVAVSQRRYVEPWRSFMLFKDDGTPIWRGELVTLVGALPDGGDSQIRVTSFEPEIVDEHGGGLMDSTGVKAPISVRLANYTGGALVGLGGSSPGVIAKRHAERVKMGGWRGQGDHLIPSQSPTSGSQPP